MLLLPFRGLMLTSRSRQMLGTGRQVVRGFLVDNLLEIVNTLKNSGITSAPSISHVAAFPAQLFWGRGLSRRHGFVAA